LVFDLEKAYFFIREKKIFISSNVSASSEVFVSLPYYISKREKKQKFG